MLKNVLDCANPPSVTYANPALFGSTLLNSDATYSCNDGYTLQGDASITCEIGGWTVAPVCKAGKI